MLKKIIEISSPARLSISHRQLVIERQDEPKATLPCEDLGVVIIDNQATTYTHAVLTSLLEEGATVVVCGRNHLPEGMLLPLAAHATQTEKHRAQIEASQPTRKRIWQALVRAKIAQQAGVLAACIGKDWGLGPMSTRVQSGDVGNLEAQAAQRYWPRLFGPEFRRSRTGPPPNDLLNYGYTVLRAAAARAVAATGLIPTLGVFHHNRSNPFCLADDLIEPYRPYVDWRVRGLVENSGHYPPIGKESKRALLSLFNETVMVETRRLPLFLALHSSATSLARALTGEGVDLALPSGLPVEPDTGASELAEIEADGQA